MARRIKEASSIHRMRIASSAGELFKIKGYDNVTMDMIAKTAGYSKATLYVYFESKDEILSYLTLQSMQKLKDYIMVGINDNEGIRNKYFGICNGLYKYATLYPLYFKLVFNRINIDFNNSKFEETEKETFMVGESINSIIGDFILEGIALKEFKSDLKLKPTIFNVWGMLYGVIQLAINKSEYIKQQMDMEIDEFLNYSYDTIYKSIKA
ncbi:MAG: TetR/AcrR family transcriptional regulator [Anaeroplasmataceae bacterium]